MVTISNRQMHELVRLSEKLYRDVYAYHLPNRTKNTAMRLMRELKRKSNGKAKD